MPRRPARIGAPGPEDGGGRGFGKYPLPSRMLSLLQAGRAALQPKARLHNRGLRMREMSRRAKEAPTLPKAIKASQRLGRTAGAVAASPSGHKAAAAPSSSSTSRRSEGPKEPRLHACAFYTPCRFPIGWHLCARPANPVAPFLSPFVANVVSRSFSSFFYLISRVHSPPAL